MKTQNALTWKFILLFCFLVTCLMRIYSQDKPQNIGLSGHDFFYAGEAKINNMYIVKDGKVTWHYTRPESNGEISDASLLDNGHILFAYQHGISEIDEHKEVLWNVDAPEGSEIHTVQPIGKDHIVYVQNGLPAKVVIMQVPGKKIIREFLISTKEPPAEHNRWFTVHVQFRNARLTSRGTLIVSHMDLDKVSEYDSYGNELWSVGVVSPWSAKPLANRNVLVSSNMGFVREVNRDKETVWEIQLKDNPAYKVTAPQTSHRLPSGNTIISNWYNEFDQPSTFDAENPPVQAIEVTPDHKVVWKLCSWLEPDNLGPSTIIQPLNEPIVREKLFFGDIK